MPNISEPPKNVPWFSADDQDGVAGDPLLPENNDVPIDDLTRRYDPHQSYDCIYLKDFVSTYRINRPRIQDEIINDPELADGNIYSRTVIYEFVGDEGFIRFLGRDKFVEGKEIKSGVKLVPASFSIYAGKGTDFTSDLYNPLTFADSYIYFDRIDYITDVPWAERYSSIILQALLFYGINTGNSYGIDTAGHPAIDSMYNPYVTVQVPETIDIEISESGILRLSYFYINDLVKKKIPVQKGQVFKLDTKGISMYSLVASGAGASNFNSALQGLEILYDEIKDFSYQYQETLKYINFSRVVQSRVYELSSDTLKTPHFYASVTRALFKLAGIVNNLIPVVLGITDNSKDLLLQPQYYWAFQFSGLDEYQANILTYPKVRSAAGSSSNLPGTYYIEREIITAENNESIGEFSYDLSHYARAITLIFAQTNSAEPNNFEGFKLNPYIIPEDKDEFNELVSKSGQISEEDYSELKSFIDNKINWLASSEPSIKYKTLEEAQPYTEYFPTRTEWVIHTPEDYAPFDDRNWIVDGDYSFVLDEESANNFTAQYNSLPETNTARSRLPFEAGQTGYGAKVPDLEKQKIEAKQPIDGVTSRTQIPFRSLIEKTSQEIVSINSYRRGVDIINWAWEEKEDDITGEVTQELYQDMPDSLRVKEIHLALEAQTYATYVSTKDGKTKPRVANLGYYTKRIANVLGITALPDGVTYNPLQPTLVAAVDDDPETDQVIIPAPYRFGHWGTAQYKVSKEQLKTGVDADGNPEFEETEAPMEDNYDGIIYSFMSNKFVEDPATGEPSSIIPGGYATVHNIPQLLRQILDDVDKGLGIQESAAFALRSAEDAQTNQGSIFNAQYKSKICTYEGLHSLIGEIAYMCSEISRRASGAQLSSMVTQACVFEIMSIIGLPVDPKSFNAKVGIEESGGEIQKKIYYPGYKSDTPRMFELWTVLMENIAPILGNQYDMPEEEKEKVRAMSPEEFQEYLSNLGD